MINNVQVWLTGLLVVLATLFLTVGGVLYLMAAGDPGQVARAKRALVSSAIGYGVAALAGTLVNILKGFVAA